MMPLFLQISSSLTTFSVSLNNCKHCIVSTQLELHHHPTNRCRETTLQTLSPAYFDVGTSRYHSTLLETVKSNPLSTSVFCHTLYPLPLCRLAHLSVKLLAILPSKLPANLPLKLPLNQLLSPPTSPQVNQLHNLQANLPLSPLTSLPPMAPAPTEPAPVAKKEGPHPSYVQVAKPFICQQKIQSLQIAIGSNPTREDQYRLQGVQYIHDIRTALQL